jgi:NADPH:quinone reductase-like Zn-dependent oxidoreductase
LAEAQWPEQDDRINLDGRWEFLAADADRESLPAVLPDELPVPCTKDDLRELLDLVARGQIEPVIDRVIGFDSVREAQVDMEERRVLGKVIVTP